MADSDMSSAARAVDQRGLTLGATKG